MQRLSFCEPSRCGQASGALDKMALLGCKGSAAMTLTSVRWKGVRDAHLSFLVGCGH
jgi:hypothetical protein